jgi:hypothetical protein
MAIETLQTDITALALMQSPTRRMNRCLAAVGEMRRLRESGGLARRIERRRQEAEGGVAWRAMDCEPSNDSTPPWQ